MIDTLDLFGGAGGTDEGARSLGLDPLGVELDDAAVATRREAGHRTAQADVAEADPREFAPCDLLIASPPCQAWSAAGKRRGERDRELVRLLTDGIARRDGREIRETASWADPGSRLVTEPLRWALALSPRWIMLEQVPPVLDYWRYIGSILEREGWKVWVGILEAERYGVPQTRERAILLADRETTPHPPPPTHQRFIPGEAARREITLEGELLPWVSMAEALGWGMTERPSVTVCAGGNGPHPLDGGSGTRATLATERRGGRWLVNDAEEPTPPLTTRADQMRFVQSARSNATERDESEPAPTITSGHDAAERVWKWPWDRPATAICADPRVIGPGHKRNAESPDAPGRMENAVRVTLEEAAVLQGFRSDYPFQGNRSKQFEQVGNAVPPPFAAAILRSLLKGVLE